MTPGSSVAADMYHQLKAEQRRQWPAYYAQVTREAIAAGKVADEEYQAELAELRGMLADLKCDLTLKSLQENSYKANFNASQPRFPKGTPVQGGRWSGGSGGATASNGDNSGQLTAVSAARKAAGHISSRRVCIVIYRFVLRRGKYLTRLERARFMPNVMAGAERTMSITRRSKHILISTCRKIIFDPKK